MFLNFICISIVIKDVSFINTCIGMQNQIEEDRLQAELSRKRIQHTQLEEAAKHYMQNRKFVFITFFSSFLHFDLLRML